MLSDLLTFVLALAVCGMAVLCVYCYRLGLRDGEAPRAEAAGAARGGFAQQTAAGHAAAPARAQGWRADKYDAILANIDAYDGTEKGQKVIE